MPKARSYDLLTKNERRAYSHIHCLLDIILPIAAGSTLKKVQRLFLKDRWKFVHKEKFQESLPLTWKTLSQALVALPILKKFCFVP